MKALGYLFAFLLTLSWLLEKDIEVSILFFISFIFYLYILAIIEVNNYIELFDFLITPIFLFLLSSFYYGYFSKISFLIFFIIIGIWLIRLILYLKLELKTEPEAYNKSDIISADSSDNSNTKSNILNNNLSSKKRYTPINTSRSGLAKKLIYNTGSKEEAKDILIETYGLSQSEAEELVGLNYYSYDYEYDNNDYDNYDKDYRTIEIIDKVSNTLEWDMDEDTARDFIHD